MWEDGASQGLNESPDFILPLLGIFDRCFEALGVNLEDLKTLEAEIGAYPPGDASTKTAFCRVCEVFEIIS